MSTRYLLNDFSSLHMTLETERADIVPSCLVTKNQIRVLNLKSQGILKLKSRELLECVIGFYIAFEDGDIQHGLEHLMIWFFQK